MTNIAAIEQQIRDLQTKLDRKKKSMLLIRRLPTQDLYPEGTIIFFQKAETDDLMSHFTFRKVDGIWRSGRWRGDWGQVREWCGSRLEEGVDFIDVVRVAATESILKPYLP